MIKAVLIDVDNTLLDFNKSAEMAIIMGFNEFKLNYNQNVFLTFKNVNDMLWEKIQNKQITREFLHAERFNIIFEKININFNGKIFEKAFLENLNFCACPVDGSIELLRYLSKKYLVYTASNAPSEQQHKRIKLSGIDRYIQKAFISQDLGFDKPDIKFFNKCLEYMKGINKDEIILIGDSLSADIKGAKNFGIKTIWFNYYCTNVDEEKISDFEVKNLLEIKNII